MNIALKSCQIKQFIKLLSCESRITPDNVTGVFWIKQGRQQLTIVYVRRGNIISSNDSVLNINTSRIFIGHLEKSRFPLACWSEIPSCHGARWPVSAGQKCLFEVPLI